MDKYEKLAQLQKLKDGGSISQEEFEAEKSKLLNDKSKKKSHTGLIIVIVAILVIGGLCLLADKMWSSSGKHGTSVVQQQSSNPTKNTNTSTAYETEIIGKWNKTLPLNNTNGLICAVYNIESDCLYLKYNMGICVVDENDTVTRCIEGDIQYSVIDTYISMAKKGNEKYKYLTNTQFEALINN